MTAVVAIALLMLLILFMDWVPTPLNRNILLSSAAERLPSTVIHSLMCLAAIAAQLTMVKWAMAAAAAWFSLVLASAVINWWVPYFFGVAKGEITAEIFQTCYAENTRVLPTRGASVIVPDLQHILIHSAVLFAALASWWAFTTGS